MNFIGVDLHKKSITVCVMDEKQKALARTGWPPTRPRPAAGPSATKSCFAWPKHSPTFPTLMREVVVLKHCQGVDATADLRADRPHRLVCRFPLVQEAGKACGNE